MSIIIKVNLKKKQNLYNKKIFSFFNNKKKQKKIKIVIRKNFMKY